MSKPAVLFVCVKNAGKSQMAAGLMRKITGPTVDVHSAGTESGTSVNALSAECLLEVGVDITGEHPKPIDPELVGDVDIVVTLGNEAHVEPVGGTRFETWDIDEPGGFQSTSQQPKTISEVAMGAERKTRRRGRPSG
ncbi:low molecular weight phosphatase family protein, partial [Mycobacterium sp. THU-M104]|uniref:arsenate-mycothiol transferase ArsC n=1 Tax=Mycobacterium sp. THU-M104 TaxID=3410515 RepID=UPI003B9C2E82